MSELAKLQELYEEFVREFLHPLLAGGTARPTQVLPAHAHEAFSAWRPSDSHLEADILAGLHDVAAHVAQLEGAVPFPDPGGTALAMAASNLLYVTDPEIHSFPARGAIPKVVAFADELIEKVDVPRTRGEALVRHALLMRFLELQRIDTVVHTWAQIISYFGRQPPKSITSMPKLRAVREEKIRRRAVDLVDEYTFAAQLRALVSRSPVTALIRHELFPEIIFGWSTLSVLSDQGIRHGIAEALAARHTDYQQASRLGQAAIRLAEEIEDEAMAGPARWFVLALLVEIQLSMALEYPDVAETLVPDLTGLPRDLQSGAGFFYGVLPAVAASPYADTLLSMSGRDREVVESYLDAARQRVPEVLVAGPRAFLAHVTAPPGLPPISGAGMQDSTRTDLRSA